MRRWTSTRLALDALDDLARAPLSSIALATMLELMTEAPAAEELMAAAPPRALRPLTGAAKAGNPREIGARRAARLRSRPSSRRWGWCRDVHSGISVPESGI